MLLLFCQTGLPSSGYSHFHTPVSYPQVPSYGPFGGLPPYGYPPGMAHRPMPGNMQHHMGMMPPGPMMPPRIGTPPTVPSMPMARSHTPSPEPVLPVTSTSVDVKEGQTQTKSTLQQGTQTIPKQGTQSASTKKKPSSRPSSRRNSEDKTEQPPREKKKEEAKVDKETANKVETTNKEAPRGNQTPEPQPQRQRQGIEQALKFSIIIM